MTAALDASVLDVVLDSWTRSNAALIGLLRLLPANALAARATPTSPSIGEMCAHLHRERMISVVENAPEQGAAVPVNEWAAEPYAETIAALLADSGARLEAAVRRRISEARALDQDFVHPLLQLVQFLIFNHWYHHGQIMLALKAAAVALPDELVGEQVWDAWRARESRRTAR